MKSVEEYFNLTYEETYAVLLRYVSLRLSGVGAYHDICDIMQEPYSEFFKIINKKGISYVKNPLAILYKIASIRLKRIYSKKKKAAEILPLYISSGQDEEELFIADFENVTGLIDEEKIIDKMLAEEILSVIKNGDEESAKIFMLRYEQDMQLEDISKELGLELHTVRNKLYRKIAELRKIFNERE